MVFSERLQLRDVYMCECANYGIEVLDTGHHAHGHLASVGWRLGAWVERGAETLADLLHPRLQLVALEEDYEDGLVDLVALHKFSEESTYKLRE